MILDLHHIARAMGGIVSKDEVLCPGPGHSTKDRSLSIKINTDGTDILVHTFSPADDPIAAKDYARQKIGLDPFKPNGGRRRPRATSADIAALFNAMQPEEPKGVPVATYDYKNAEGKTLYQVLRFEPKTFRQRRRDGDRWTWNLDGVTRVLYRLPELQQYPDGTVFYTEGEKDADNVATLSLVATTAASGTLTPEMIEPLRGRDVIVLQDNDGAGLKKAHMAARALHPVAGSVRVVLLPDLPPGGDVSDWIELDPRRKNKLAETCFAAPLWTPETAPAPETIADAPKVEELPPLSFINVTTWHDQPIPERQWAVLNRIPLRNVTLFSGEGAVGKSIVSLQLAVAHVLGRDWLGTMPEIGPVLAICAEDDTDELWRRLACIVEYYGASFADLKNLHLISLAGKDALLAAPDRVGLMQPTKLFAQLKDAAHSIKPKLIVVDNCADVYAGNENDRAQVRQFIGLLRGLAITADAGVLLTSHPSLTGMNTGSGISGSTAWHASVRSRLYMKKAQTEQGEEPDPTLRVIEVMKSNYGPVGETIMARWKDGLFLPEPSAGSLEKMAAEQAADELFLKLLDRFQQQGRNVSDKKNAPNYAPTMFATDPDGRGKRNALADAMARLFTTGKIRVETYGKQSQPHSKLVRNNSNE